MNVTVELSSVKKGKPERNKVAGGKREERLLFRMADIDSIRRRPAVTLLQNAMYTANLSSFLFLLEQIVNFSLRMHNIWHFNTCPLI
jgi:hypothetical protein